MPTPTSHPPQQIVTLDLTYRVTDTVPVALPVGLTWADVLTWEVYWDQLQVTLRDQSVHLLPLALSPGTPDVEHPTHVQVYDATATLIADTDRL